MAALDMFQSTWSEIDMLRPSSMDPKVLNERKELDKIFGLLLNLNSAFKYMIKSILREPKLSDFEEVCSRIQKGQGNIGLFGGKGELVMANKSLFKQEDRKSVMCEHCKRNDHIKYKCWILYLHLKPSRFKDSKANISQKVMIEPASSSNQGGELAKNVSMEYVKKSDLEDLIKAYASKLSGCRFCSCTSSTHCLLCETFVPYTLLA